MTQEQLNDRDTGAVLQEDTARTNGQDETMATTKAKDTGRDLAALIRERNKLDEQIREQRAEAVDAFKTRIMEEAAELEVDLLELFTPKRKTNGRGKGVSSGPPKYLNPKTGDTFSGRGRTASWLQALIDEGKEKDDFVNPAWQKANE